MSGVILTEASRDASTISALRKLHNDYETFLAGCKFEPGDLVEARGDGPAYLIAGSPMIPSTVLNRLSWATRPATS